MDDELSKNILELYRIVSGDKDATYKSVWGKFCETSEKMDEDFLKEDNGIDYDIKKILVLDRIMSRETGIFWLEQQ